MELTTDELKLILERLNTLPQDHESFVFKMELAERIEDEIEARSEVAQREQTRQLPHIGLHTPLSSKE